MSVELCCSIWPFGRLGEGKSGDIWADGSHLVWEGGCRGGDTHLLSSREDCSMVLGETANGCGEKVEISYRETKGGPK